MYYYAICKENHTYFSIIIRKFLEDSPDWESTKNKRYAHYCDCPTFGKIKHQLPIKHYIFYKTVLAIILRTWSSHPTTFVIKNGRISDSRYTKALTFNSKWFLKPHNEGGGSGIQVLSKLQDWKKHVNRRKQYVLQRGIEGCLYEGRKFDLRSHILVVVSKTNVYFYLSKDSCMRISNYTYDKKNMSKGVNITNTCYQRSSCNKINAMALSQWEYYLSVQPKLIEATRQFGDKIRPFIKNTPSVSLLGCDFVIDENLQPHFIEINNAIGFTHKAHPPDNPNLVKEMICEIIDIGYKPLLTSQVPPDKGKHWIKC